MDKDPLIKKALEYAAEQNNISYEEAKMMVKTMFDWTRTSMSSAEYTCYLLPRFGTFTYFNKYIKTEDGEYVKGVNNRIEADLYEDITKIKDKNRSEMIKEFSRNTEIKEPIIEEIAKHHILKYSTLRADFTRCAWLYEHPDNTYEGDWNKIYMYCLTVEKLQELLDKLNQMNNE